jgi:hypothetical protein
MLGELLLAANPARDFVQLTKIYGVRNTAAAHGTSIALSPLVSLALKFRIRIL